MFGVCFFLLGCRIVRSVEEYASYFHLCFVIKILYLVANVRDDLNYEAVQGGGHCYAETLVI